MLISKQTRQLLAGLFFSIALAGCKETGDPAEYDKIVAVKSCDRLATMLADYEASEKAEDEAGNDGAAGEFRAYADTVERRQARLDCTS